MKKRKVNDEETLAVLAEVESGGSIAEACRKHQISEATYHRRRAEFAGLDRGSLARERELEEENRRLKKLLAETLLANEILEEANELLRKL